MSSKTKTGYGLHETMRRIARRVQQERDRAELEPRPPAIALPPRPWCRTEKRPLAA